MAAVAMAVVAMEVEAREVVVREAVTVAAEAVVATMVVVAKVVVAMAVETAAMATEEEEMAAAAEMAAVATAVGARWRRWLGWRCLRSVGRRPQTESPHGRLDVQRLSAQQDSSTQGGQRRAKDHEWQYNASAAWQHGVQLCVRARVSRL